jgi:hypothetical protein
MEAVRDGMSLAKSAVVSSTMGDDTEATEGVGGLGWKAWWLLVLVVVQRRKMSAWKLILGCKGVGAQGSWPTTTKLVAWVGNGMGFIPCMPYVEGDEINIKQGD